MEFLKIIPQVFFDLIARVVPGSVGIVAYLLLSGKTWETSLAYIFGDSFSQGSPALSLLIFLATGYIIGELISPAAKEVQRIGEKGIRKYFIENVLAKVFTKSQNKKEIKLTGEQLKEKKEEENLQKQKKLEYDRLRFTNPDVGALCAKIRAEFTMHNGLAVVFALSALSYPLIVISYPFNMSEFHLSIEFILIIMMIVTANRGRATNDTFKDTVSKFTQISNEQKESIKLKQPEYVPRT
ncbi:MAG: hypothetical protein WBP41_07095 [Saprospiraceae bacterium]